MAILATDNFNRADNADLGAAWDPVTNEGALKIASNAVAPTAVGTDAAESYNGVTWPDDQYSQAKITTVGGFFGTGEGVIVRASTSQHRYYSAIADDAQGVEVGKRVDGVYTMLSQIAATWIAGDVLRLEVQGTTLRVFQNGAQIGADVTGQTDLATGRAGLRYSSTATSATMDDWEGGSVGAASTAQRSLPNSDFHTELSKPVASGVYF